MDMVEKAVCKSFDLIYDDVYLDYARIYTRSNENLPALFSNFSVKDKDVLKNVTPLLIPNLDELLKNPKEALKELIKY